MQSSAPRRGVSGATNPMAPSTSQGPSSDSRASSESFIQESTGHIAPNLNGATAADTAWYYHQSGTQPSTREESAQPPASSSSSTMIGPTFTSYNAENAPFNEDETANYQQWVNSYNQQAQSQPQHHQPVYGASYGQDASALPRPEAQGASLSRNPYNFMQNQYTSSNTTNQYGGSTSATALPAGLDSTSFQSQGTDAYPPYYSEILAMNTNTTSSPEQAQSYHGSTPEASLHSYSNSPDPLFQQQQHQAQQQQQQQQMQHHAQQMPSQQTHFQQQQSRQQSRHGSHPQHAQPQQIGQRQQQPRAQQHIQQYQTQNQSQKPHVPQPPQRFVQQQLNPPVVANRQTQKPPAKSSDFQQQPPQAVRFAAPRNPPEQVLPSQPITPSTQGPAVAPSVSPQWSTEGTFQSKKAAPSSTVIHQYVPPSSSNFVAAKAGPSQAKPPPATNAPLKRATAPSAAEESVNTSPGNKTSAKRKRFKKNDSPEVGVYGGGDSDSDSEEDFDGLGMSGRIEVGLGGLGVVGKGKKDKGPRL